MNNMACLVSCRTTYSSCTCNYDLHQKTYVKTVSLAYVIQSWHCTKMPLPNLSMEFTKGNVLKITLIKVSKKVCTGAKWPIQLELLWVSVA